MTRHRPEDRRRDRYPNAVYRLLGHPVTWIGKFITWCDEDWNSGTRASRRLYGVLTLTLLLVVAVLSGLAIAGILDRLLPGLASLILCGVLASTLLAQRSLDDHVLAVAKGLETEGLTGGRWVLLDFVDFVIHLFHPETRSFYQL